MASFIYTLYDREENRPIGFGRTEQKAIRDAGMRDKNNLRNHQVFIPSSVIPELPGPTMVRRVEELILRHHFENSKIPRGQYVYDRIVLTASPWPDALQAAPW